MCRHFESLTSLPMGTLDQLPSSAVVKLPSAVSTDCAYGVHRSNAQDYCVGFSSWQQISSPVSWEPTTGLAVALPTGLILRIVDNSVNPKVYSSADGGNTWSTVADTVPWEGRRAGAAVCDVGGARSRSV